MGVPISRQSSLLYSRIFFGFYGVYATISGARGLYSGYMPRLVASVLTLSGGAMPWVATRRIRRAPSPTSKATAKEQK